jgi:hypothetical protein
VSAAPAPDGAAAPVVTVVSGDPSPEEVAALVAVLSAVGGAHEDPPPAHRSPWSDPAWRLTGPGARPGGWRTSGLPR